jgi:hypothetical protein
LGGKFEMRKEDRTFDRFKIELPATSQCDEWSKHAGNGHPASQPAIHAEPPASQSKCRDTELECLHRGAYGESPRSAVLSPRRAQGRCRILQGFPTSLPIPLTRLRPAIQIDTRPMRCLGDATSDHPAESEADSDRLGPRPKWRSYPATSPAARIDLRKPGLLDHLVDFAKLLDRHVGRRNRPNVPRPRTSCLVRQIMAQPIRQRALLLRSQRISSFYNLGQCAHGRTLSCHAGGAQLLAG